FNSLMIFKRVSEEMNLSNFSLIKTSQNSSKVALLTTKNPKCLALSNANFGFELEVRKALIKVFVSITKSLIFIQKLFQNFFGKSVFCGFFSSFIQKLFKGSFLILFGKRSQSYLKQFFDRTFKLWGYLSPSLGCSRIDFENNSFHNSVFI